MTVTFYIGHVISVQDGICKISLVENVGLGTEIIYENPRIFENDNISIGNIIEISTS